MEILEMGLIGVGVMLVSALFGCAGGLVAVWFMNKNHEIEMGKVREEIISLRNSEKGKSSVNVRQAAKDAEAAKNERYAALVADLTAAGMKYISLKPEEKASLDLMKDFVMPLAGKYPDLLTDAALGALKK